MVLEPAVKFSVTSAAPLLLALAANAQDLSPSPQTDERPSFRVPSNLVFLPARVQNKRGDGIYGLAQDQFIVEDDGVRQTVSIEESPDSEGLSLVLTVQCGRSAAAEFEKLKGLGTMVEEIVGSAPSEVAVVVYGERAYLLDDFSTSAEGTRRALSRLKSCGDYHAATIDAVHYSLDLLKNRPNRYRRAILLIGEQRDHGSSAKLQEVVGELGATNTVIYTIAFSPAKSQFLSELRYGPDGPKKPEPPTTYSSTPHHAPQSRIQTEVERSEAPEYTDHAPLLELPPLLQLAVNALKENTAAEIAALSGGEYFNFVTQRGLEQALQRVASHVHDYYLLSFQPRSSTTLGLHSIRVRVAGHPDAIIEARKSYWPGLVQ
jgi:VWFA-related protein